MTAGARQTREERERRRQEKREEETREERGADGDKRSLPTGDSTTDKRTQGNSRLG